MKRTIARVVYWAIKTLFWLFMVALVVFVIAGSIYGWIKGDRTPAVLLSILIAICAFGAAFDWAEKNKD
jgi:hypothetical protein